MIAQPNIAVLVPGRLHEHAVRRIGESFDLKRIERANPALLTPELARGIRGLATVAGVDAAFIDALPNLEIIAYFGVGYDVIDAEHAGKKSVMVTNTPDVLTEEVADSAIGLLLNTVREFPKAETWLRQGRWVKEGSYPLTRGTLRGKRAGIFGMGRIGTAIARRLEAFGIPVSYHNRRPVEGSGYKWYPSLKELAAAVDILISAAPGGASTDRAVNAEVLAALGPDGVFINIGRGSVVDETALIAALSNGAIRAAGLDVFANEPHVPDALLALDNACLLPHVASATVHTRQAMANLVVDNLASWFSEGRPLTPVPETQHVKARPRS